MGRKRSFRRRSPSPRRKTAGARSICWSRAAWTSSRFSRMCRAKRILRSSTNVKKNIVCVGHVPDAIRGSEASNAGQKSFEHLIGMFEGSSTAEDELLKGPKGPGKFLDTYDPQKEAALIALLAKNQTWQCPTLFWERGQWLVDVIDVTKDLDLKYAPALWRDQLW